MPRKYAAMRNTPVRITVNTSALSDFTQHVARELHEGSILKDALAQIGRDIQKQVLNTERVQGAFRHNDGAPLRQSGKLLEVLRKMRPGVSVQPQGMQLHWGRLTTLNRETLRAAQTVRLRRPSGKSRTVRFAAERQFPSWIMAEYGIAPLGQRVNLAHFALSYSKRPDTGGPAFGGRPEGYAKTIWPNIGQWKLENGAWKKSASKRHPGIRAPRLFSSAVFLVRKDLQSGRNPAILVALRRILNR